jgi:hypothetical protein
MFKQPKITDFISHYHEIQKAKKMRDTAMLTDTFKNGHRVTETTKKIDLKPLDKTDANKKNNMSLRGNDIKMSRMFDRPLGQLAPRRIDSSTKPPPDNTNSKKKSPFKVRSDAIEPIGDGLFRNKEMNFERKNNIKVFQTVPPLTVKGQKPFPTNKQEFMQECAKPLGVDKSSAKFSPG